MHSNDVVYSLQEYIERVKKQRESWGENSRAWFRGEPNCDTPLLPKVYRRRHGRDSHDENALLQMFRMKAGTFSANRLPDRGHTDQWLFLAQHVGLPTRLLDWTESALVGLYFALAHTEPVVWMIEPFKLNELSITTDREHDFKIQNVFPLTWIVPEEPGVVNIGSANINSAWERGNGGVEFPVAIVPTNVHPRMSAQRSTFTVHGRQKASINTLVPEEILARFVISKDKVADILRDLHLLGIHDSTAFPDLDGLARELSDLY